ncbi:MULTISPECIES: tail fiber domain-containing protein [unclassified Burkholderia]|uniref:tail fiber domain-containing protein n=1 Tax=unclassified Burkholderia TaxID=2613784 RepID=UPI000F5823BA|nr:MULTISPECIES: tail fiber domain-containing protein [unclassified Burkholderia]RQR87628.1 hypothetical protein DIE10_05925 [Burkholderia sp. Bp9011]RQR96975.1 hypothetical protein DIE09_06110 [Burkholderia sp. Bp9010]RQS80681.1 hypothetical protein DID97_05590 [Burkholderia sp. Bp8977]
MASILPNGKTQFIDVNGRPLVRGRVFYYEPNTETFKDTYTDSSATTPNTNPVVLDASGQATIWGIGYYRQVVYDWKGNLLWDEIVSEVEAAVDDLKSSLAGGSGASLIGFIQTGVGAVARSMQDELREIIKVTQFGVLGDGSDQSSKIIKAWEEAVNQNAELVFPRGKYLVSENLSASLAAVKIRGDGQQKSILTFSGGSGIVVDNSGLTTIRLPLEISGMSLLTNGAKVGTAVSFTGSVSTRYGQQLLIRDSEINGINPVTCWNTPVVCVNAGQSTIDRCMISGGGSTVRTPRMISLTGSKDFRLINSTLVNFDDGLLGTGDTEGVLVHNSQLVAGRRGVISDNNVGNMFVVTANHFAVRERAVVLGTGAATNGSNDSKISDNFIIGWDPGDAGTYDDWVGVEVFSSYNQIHHNEFYRAGMTFRCDAVRVSVSATRSASSNTIESNLYNTTTNGTVIAAGATSTQLSFNRSIGVTGQQLIDGGSTTRTAFLDTDLFLGAGGMKAHIPGVAAPREMRFHPAGSSTWDARFTATGGTAGTNGQGAITISGVRIYTTDVLPSSSNTFSLGSASGLYTSVWAASGTVNPSDARLKSDVRAFSDAEISASQAIGEALGIYQFLASIAEKGADAARLHSGMTVQHAIEIMEAHGLEPMRYGFICHDEWDAREEVLDEDGVTVIPARDAGDLYSFRYSELLVFVMAGAVAKQKADALAFEGRIAALEASANA